MKLNFPEQLDGDTTTVTDTPKQKRFSKRIYRRRFRRWGKRLLDKAPKKYYYKGWST